MLLLKTDIRPQPYQVRTYYPHLAPEDTELWTKFVEQNPDFGTLVYYDLPVGTLPDAINGAEEPWVEKYGRQTYSKRIDVVVPTFNTIYVIEVKPHASAVALGQAILYRHCIQPLLPADTHAQAMIVTDTADVDLLAIAGDMHIQIEQLDKRGGRGKGIGG